MELTVQEKNHVIWHKIDEYLSELIANAQRKNEGPLTIETTSELRGRIRAYRMIQSLGDEVPIVNEDE
jgi:hypothetical protein